MSKVPAKGKA